MPKAVRKQEQHRARSVFGKPEAANAADDEQDDGCDQAEDFEGRHSSILPTMRLAMMCSPIPMTSHITAKPAQYLVRG